MHGKLLTLLLRRTEEKVIDWQPTGRPYAYQYVGSSGRVVLRSRDEDNDYPVSFEVYDNEGQMLASYLTWQFDDNDNAVPWDTAVRRLWRAVNKANDPVALLVRELEELPPF